MQTAAKRLTVIPKELLQFLAADNRPVKVQNLNLPENLWSDLKRIVHEKLRQSSYVVLCCRVQTCRADRVYNTNSASHALCYRFRCIHNCPTVLMETQVLSLRQARVVGKNSSLMWYRMEGSK